MTTALGNNWVLNFRQADYNPIHNDLRYDAINREFIVIRKFDDNWQLYAGYFLSRGSGDAKNLRKNVIQGGIIGTEKLGDRTTFVINRGGGW